MGPSVVSRGAVSVGGSFRVEIPNGTWIRVLGMEYGAPLWDLVFFVGCFRGWDVRCRGRNPGAVCRSLSTREDLWSEPLRIRRTPMFGLEVE